MDKQLLLLRELHLNPVTTQRNIAKAVGLSLGSVNELIKQMVNMGILKIEKISQKKVIYNLTSLGITQRAEGTYKYISEAYAFLNELNKRIDDLLNGINGNNAVVLFGKNDGLCDIIKTRLDFNGIQYIITNSFEEIKLLSEKNKILIIVWNPEKVALLNDNYNYIDLLSYI
ncbi:winged helix-turn-helix transcriptional regulator [Acetivibrio clariflavus]|uniref:winged helix-turn-helix transcriptional regulator n=1 Tax=Acetivibrio clariflavus TaxID=288965 RepID=UPI000484FCC3|nr:winged helix-turn-helix transcriptional regulator [Acetivibrio clariflavus]